MRRRLVVLLAMATEEPTPAATATDTATPTATEQPAPEEQEGGAGDEEAARVPARFDVGPSGVQPPRVMVPAFLAIELVVNNALDEPVTVRFDGEEVMTVPAGQLGRAQVDGRRKGRYRVSFGTAGEALLITGVEPGP